MAMTKRWKVEGYAGWSDYDGPSDYNIHKELDVADFFTKEDIIVALQHHYNKYRCTVFKVDLV